MNQPMIDIVNDIFVVFDLDCIYVNNSEQPCKTSFLYVLQELCMHVDIPPESLTAAK